MWLALVELMVTMGVLVILLGIAAVRIATQKPAGVPEVYWLPLNRGDYCIDVSLRLYVPDMK